MALVICNLEDLIQALHAMCRSELLVALRAVPSRFRMDFTDDFLARQSDDRIRHLVFAAYVQARKHAGLQAMAAA